MKSFAAKILVLVWAAGLLYSAPVRAQVAGATLSGTITDAQGGAVVNAKISVRNTATGVTTESTANASGTYSIVNLLPGDYQVSISAAGFKTAASKVTLTVGATQELSLSLTVGEITQTVEVTGAAPVVETTNATLSGTVESTQIVELPLNGRDWASLATLEPGVTSVRPHEAVDAPGGDTRGLGVQMTINGARPQQNVYRLNGVIVNDYSNAGPGNVLGFNLGVDAVQEFSVLTSNYSAEYGFTSGGVINAVTKSGTNTFHGTAYEFVRNDKFDAANFFENANGEKKGAFRRNQFGASAGWKLLKDRAFLFGDYEGLRQVKDIPQTAQTLAPNARLGILNDASGNQITPAQGIANGTLTPTGGCVFPNETNLAPGKASVCVDNTMANLISASGTPVGRLDPLPNGALLTPDFNVGIFFSDAKQPVSDNYGTVRGDLKISDKDSLTGSWYRDHSFWYKPDTLNEVISGFTVPHQAYTLEESHIFSPAMVNTVRLGLNESNLTSPSISDSNQVGLDTTLGMVANCTAPGVNIGAGGLSSNSATADGFGGFSTAGGFKSNTRILEVFDDLSVTKRNHNLKFGFMWLKDSVNMSNGGACTGSAAFGSIQDFLQNIPSQVRMPQIPPFTTGNTVHHNRAQVFGGYFQDDWKMRPNLTVNLGLRYEMSTIPSETQGKINQLETISQDPGFSCVADVNGLATCPGFYHQTFQRNPTLRNFEPRIGFAWDPFHNGKTSVRGGFGLFDVLPLPFMFALNALQVAPNGLEVDLTNPGQGTFPKGFPALATGATASQTARGRWGYNEPFPNRNYVMQWNFNIQRQLTSTTSITLAYTGSRGIHNPWQTDELNTVEPYKTSAGYLFPNPVGSGCLPGPPDCSQTDAALGLPIKYVNAGSNCVNGTANSSTAGGCVSSNNGKVPGLLINSDTALIQSTIFQSQSWYNGLEVNVLKRMSHGLQVEGSFTWGKSFDTSSGSFAGDNYANNITPTVPYYDLSITKGLSDFNITRNLVINGLWQIPTPASLSGPAGWVAKGWGMGGVLELSDGVPMWPLDGIEGDPAGQLNGEPMTIPDYVPGCQLTNPSSGRHGSLQYINPNCFINALAPNSQFFNAAPPFGCDSSFISNYAKNNPKLPPLNPLTCINLFGNLSRNTVIGPGLINLDYSLTKDTPIKKVSETFNIQFRAEMFNILNRTNFAHPNVNNLEPLTAGGTPAPNFGVLTSTQTPNREIQFALKLIW